MTEDKEFHEDVLNQPEYPSQKTPLHLACLNDYPEIVTFLLSKGVNPNLVDFVNDLNTPLHETCRIASEVTASLLLQEGAFVDVHNKKGSTPLHLACFGYPSVVRLLLQYGADIESLDESHWTPLHIASSQCSIHLIKLLFKSGANMLARTKRDLSASELTSQRNCRQLLLQLMRYQATREPWLKFHYNETMRDKVTPFGSQGSLRKMMEISDLVRFTTEYL